MGLAATALSHPNPTAFSLRNQVLKPALILSLAIFGLTCPAQARDDFQYWNTLEITKRLNQKWDLFFRPEMRVENGASHLFYHEYRQGVRFKPSEQLEIGVNYLFSRNENSSGKVREEHTGELEATPKAEWGSFVFSLRGRLSLRTIEGSSGEQEYQIRLMPKVACPTEIFGHKATPYVANDAFYDYTRKAWNQNRVFLGVLIPMKEVKGVRTSVDLYYMNQSLLGARNGRSGNHILGAKLNLQF